MAALDFPADRLRSKKIIASGNGYPELAIYSKNSLGVDNSGGIDATVLAPATENVYLFVSGSIGSVQNNSRGTVMFGGDVPNDVPDHGTWQDCDEDWFYG